MSDIIVTVFSEEAYFSVFEDHNKMDYYNYLAKVHQEIEAYKHNHTNFIEYVLHKSDIDSLSEKLDMKNSDFAKNIDILKEFNLSEDKKGKEALPKVPDYLLKVVESFSLPLRITVNDINDAQLFNSIKLKESTVDKIQQIFNQYCFLSEEIDDLGSHICEGQITYSSPDLLSYNTYEDISYDIKFESFIFDGKQAQYNDEPYDELFINDMEKNHFTIKNLTVLFEGSLYEYRNFLFNNHSILLNVAYVINEDLKSQFGNKFVVKPAIDRFVVSRHLKHSYMKILQHFLHMNAFNDLEADDTFELPDDLTTVDPHSLTMKDNYILMSNFKTHKKTDSKQKTETKKSSKSKDVKKHRKNNVDIERLRKIHEEKFPNIPFVYDEEDEE